MSRETVHRTREVWAEFELDFTREEVLEMADELGIRLEPGDELPALHRLIRDIDLEIMAARDFATIGALTWCRDRIKELQK